MRWEDERYVRLYTRDTTTWMMLSWQSRFVLMSLLRKVDRAGVLDVGEDGLEGLAAVIQVPLEIVEQGMPPLIKRGTVQRPTPHVVVLPKFIEAQESSQSDKARQRASRERARDYAARRELESRDDASRHVTEPSHDGTTPSHAVTTGHPVPSRSVPSVPNQEIPPNPGWFG